MHFENAVGSKTSSARCANEISSLHMYDFDMFLELNLLCVLLVTAIAVEVSPFGYVQSFVVSKAIHRFESFGTDLKESS